MKHILNNMYLCTCIKKAAAAFVIIVASIALLYSPIKASAADSKTTCVQQQEPSKKQSIYYRFVSQFPDSRIKLELILSYETDDNNLPLDVFHTSDLRYFGTSDPTGGYVFFDREGWVQGYMISESDGGALHTRYYSFDETTKSYQSMKNGWSLPLVIGYGDEIYNKIYYYYGSSGLDCKKLVFLDRYKNGELDVSAITSFDTYSEHGPIEEVRQDDIAVKLPDKTYAYLDSYHYHYNFQNEKTGLESTKVYWYNIASKDMRDYDSVLLHNPNRIDEYLIDSDSRVTTKIVAIDMKTSKAYRYNVATEKWTLTKNTIFTIYYPSGGQIHTYYTFSNAQGIVDSQFVGWYKIDDKTYVYQDKHIIKAKATKSGDQWKYFYQKATNSGSVPYTWPPARSQWQSVGYNTMYFDKNGLSIKIYNDAAKKCSYYKDGKWSVLKNVYTTLDDGYMYYFAADGVMDKSFGWKASTSDNTQYMVGKSGYLVAKRVKKNGVWINYAYDYTKAQFVLK